MPPASELLSPARLQVEHDEVAVYKVFGKRFLSEQVALLVIVDRDGHHFFIARGYGKRRSGFGFEALGRGSVVDLLCSKRQSAVINFVVPRKADKFAALNFTHFFDRRFFTEIRGAKLPRSVA